MIDKKIRIAKHVTKNIPGRKEQILRKLKPSAKSCIEKVIILNCVGDYFSNLNKKAAGSHKEVKSFEENEDDSAILRQFSPSKISYNVQDLHTRLH